MPSGGSSMQASVPNFSRLQRAGAHLVACAAMVGAGAPLAADAGQNGWTGAWEGELQNFPIRPGAPVIKIRREVGSWPAKVGECADLRTIYSENGVEKGRKDYRLCLGATPDQFIVDEGNGVELKARLLDGKLVTTFKYGATILIAITRVQGEQMTEEIYSSADQPASDSIVTMPTRNLQLLTFHRVKE